MKTKNFWEREKRKPLTEEQQEWLLYYLGYHSQEELLKRYDKNHTPKLVSATDIFNDKRRIPTVRKYLESLNLIQKGWNKNFEPINEEILNILPSYAKEPVFDTAGIKKIQKEHSHNECETVPAKSIHDKYIKIDSLIPEQMIHIFLYQESYSFRILFLV